MKFYPAILTGSPAQAQEQLDLAMEFAACDVVHIDLIDGVFADNLTITPADLASCEFGSLQCDLHIMTVEPEDLVNEAVEFAAALPVRALIGQVEKMSDEKSFVDAVRRQGWQAGLSLDLDTALDSIDEAIWQELQLVQVMGIAAGEQGRTFVERTLQLIDEVVQLRKEQELNFELVVDGGIRPELITTLAQHRVDSCSIGSFLWRSSEPVAQWQAIQG